MSITDQEHRSDASKADAGDGAARRPFPLGGRRLVAVAAGGVAVVAVAGIAIAAGLSHRSGGTDAETATPAHSARLVAPDRLEGATPVPLAQDITQGKDWKAQAAQALGGAKYFARTYSTSPTSPTARLVMAETDLTGKLEQAWAADGGAAVGDDRCTQNLKLGDNVGVRPTVSLCWRITDDFSAYVLVIDPRRAVKPKAAAAMLDAAWKQATA